MAALEEFYITAMNQNPAWYTKDLNLYCSHSRVSDYIDDYRTKFTFDPSNFADESKPMFLKKSKGKCKITPVDWMGSSNRIILAPKENMVLGTDRLSDMNAINISPRVYWLECGITGTLDCNIIDTGAVWFNELT